MEFVFVVLVTGPFLEHHYFGLTEIYCQGPGLTESIDLSTLVVPFPELAPVVFFCLKQTTCPRSWCIHMLNPWLLCRISIMVILLNCVTLGMYQPCENIDCTSDRCQILQAFDAFIYIFFALEMVVKMVALGIFGRRCYLGDTWNRLDFFIVMSGMVEYSLDLQNINLSAIRTVRVLRPLKAINRVPSMRILVNLLLDTLPMLGNVLLLCFFVFFIFGIIGVQLWAGLLRNRCYLEENFTLSSGLTLPAPYYQPEEDDERPFICSLAQDNGIMSCGDVPARREGGRTCCLDREDAYHRQSLGAVGLCINWNQYYTRCHTGHNNPHKGAINFDNIVYAWIVIFQVITLEGWVEIMYYVMDAHSFYNFIYFIFLIIIGSFFMINLCLVVIATQFSETKQREHQLMQEQRAQCLSSSTLASLHEPGDCYEELFQLVCHMLRKARRRSVALYNQLRGRPLPPPPTRGRGRGGGRGGGSANGGERHHLRQPQSPCPHQSKLDPVHSSQPLGNSIALAVPQNTEDCPQCAAALSLRQGAGAVGDSANGEDEEGAVEETDREENHLEEKAEEGEGVKKKRKRRSCFGHCKDMWDEMRKKLWGIVESKYFNRGIMIAILINTISMGIEHHNQPEELTNVLEISNIVFTSMFTLEMILKLTAFGFFAYLRNPYNIFDGIIVIISVCEIIGQSDGGLSVLRTFRLLRVIKLVRFMPALRRQLVVLMKTMDNVATFCMLLMLFIFIFSILGMHIFGCKFSLKTDTGDTVPDRKNFDSLLWAIVTVFQILTQEDWNMVLYNGMASTSPCAALYFVALMTFGNYVLFNLLVAILVEGFQAELCTLTPNGHLDLSPTPTGLYTADRLTFALGSRKNSVISLGRANLEDRVNLEGRALVSGGRKEGGRRLERGGKREGGRYNGKENWFVTDWVGTRCVLLWLQSIQEMTSNCPFKNLCFRIQKMMEVYRPEWCETREDWSVFLFSPQNRFRRVCQSIIAYKMFDYVVLAFIFSNCITVALERPKIMQGSLERVFLTISNYVFTAIFVAEMTLKVVSMGLYIGEQAYLKSSWNVLDGFLVFVSLIDIVVSMAGGAKILGVLRVLRLLRTLRPLRVISRAPGLKLVVETLITSLKPIGNIVLICCAFFIIFGILGVQLFKGKFFYCFGPDVKNITNKSDCLQANYKWVHHKYNFDNLGQALMSLFVLASKDGWVNIMYHGLDAVGVDQQPVINNSPWMLLYFISFLLIVSFFVLNMFVGVVVENFHKCRQNQEVEEAKGERINDGDAWKRRGGLQPPPPVIHTLCTTYYLDLFITFIICINVITMSLEHYSQPRSLDLVLKYCNYFFTSTFVLETLLKLTAFGFRRFFKDRWNQLDLAIVLLVLRIARVLKLLKMAKGMRALLDTVVQALPQVGNLGLLFMLLFFIYAALGVELFGELVCNEDYPCEGMSRHATFENFGMAFLTLFQVSTGDNWNGIMKDTLRECPPDYGPDYSCNPSLQFISPMYFVSFVLTAQFVLINVVVAVLMKHLDDSNKEAKEEAEMDAEIELELATGALCCMGPEGVCAGGKKGGGAGGGGGGSQWLDSVSLLIKDSFEGEMLMIDNLSGSVFHHYSSTSSPVWKDCKSHPQLEPFSLSPGGTSCSSTKAGEGSDEGGRGGGRVGVASASGSPALIRLPAEFFHPVAAAALPAPPRARVGRPSRGLRLTSPASWSSLRSQGAHSRVLCTQVRPGLLDSSLAKGSSDGSLQTTLEEGLSFSVPPPQDLVSPLPPLPLLCPPPSSGPALTLQATRGHQRSQSSGRGSISPGYTREDSMDPVPCDLEDLGIGISLSIGGCGSSQAGNSEHLSETLSSLSLTSLLSPASLAPSGVKKCNSTGSLNQGARRGEGRQILGLELDHQGFLANPWGESGGGRGEEGQLGEAPDLKGKSSSQTTVGSCSKNR
uniref:Ion transport domain-containing protein n=1 Tax=Oncorhynchus kisutch TaxID=8019 RepID=A0A8C7LFP0_ONCKI